MRVAWFIFGSCFDIFFSLAPVWYKYFQIAPGFLGCRFQNSEESIKILKDAHHLLLSGYFGVSEEHLDLVLKNLKILPKFR